MPLKVGITALLYSTILIWKVPILLHKQAKWRFIVKVAVTVCDILVKLYVIKVKGSKNLAVPSAQIQKFGI